MALNEVLRKKRIELGLSQKQVAEKTKIAQATLCRFERGKRGTHNELIIHKLMNFYQSIDKQEITTEQIKSIKKSYNEPKKTEFEIFSENVAQRLQQIFESEAEKMFKKVLKKSFKKMMKEL